MLARLLLTLIAPLLLAACLSDVPDEPAPAPETPSATVAPESSLASPAPRPSATAAPATAVPALSPDPARSPRPVTTPRGTTGLQPAGEGVTYDGDCLAGLTSARPPASPLRLPAAAQSQEFPEPYEPIPFEPDAALQATLDAALGGRAGSYAFYVKHLPTGRGAFHNPDAVFNAASLFKLFVMYEVFRQENRGEIDWQDELVVAPYYDAFALSPRATALCQVITVAQAMDAMLSVSDNAAAVLLQDLAGSGNVNAAIRALGLQHSGLFQDGLPVTAADLALLMEAIAMGRAVGPAASADMIRLLDHDVFQNGLVQGVPEGTIVARKTGNLPDATHVAGIVYAPSGPYVLVALTTNGYQTDVIRALSAAAYAHFEASSAQ